MPDISSLLRGYHSFMMSTYKTQKDTIQHIKALGTKPTTLIIAPSGMAISPSTIFNSAPRDLFVFRNLGALVPAFGTGHTGTISAIEYAVVTLGVENIIVLGQHGDETIEMLMKTDDKLKADSPDSILAWLSIAKEARDAVRKDLGSRSPAEQQTACEQECIVLSLRNLFSFPWIKKRVESGKVGLYGWYYNLEEGTLKGLNPNTGFFDPIA